MICALSTGHAFTQATNWLPEMSDDEGWLPEARSRTIALGDINGDGRADLCGRGSDGVLIGGFSSKRLPASIDKVKARARQRRCRSPSRGSRPSYFAR